MQTWKAVVSDDVAAEAAIRPLVEADIVPVAGLLAHAMRADPAYRYLFPSSPRGEGLTAFFAGNLRLHLAHDCTQVLRAGDGELIGTVTLRPPGGIPVSWMTMLRAGLWPFARAHGIAAVRRMLWLKAAYDDLEASAATSTPHRLVHMMAIAPGRQHRGYGRHLLGRVLAGVGTEPQLILLMTHTRENVRFYERAGFQVQGERTLVPPGGAAYPVWIMRLRR